VSTPARGRSLVLPGETAAVYAERIFGGRTQIVEARVTIGTTVTQLLAGNPKRIFWMAVNNAVNAGSLGFAPALTATTGIVMGPSGGFASMEVFVDGEGVSWAVYAIQSVAAGIWYTTEVMQL